MENFPQQEEQNGDRRSWMETKLLSQPRKEPLNQDVQSKVRRQQNRHSTIRPNLTDVCFPNDNQYAVDTRLRLGILILCTPHQN
jgi:hypothetical protein